MHVRTPFQASSVRFSPYVEGRIAVGTAQNFGIIGNGKQHVYQASSSAGWETAACMLGIRAMVTQQHQLS